MHPELLGAAPALWVLRPGAPSLPQPAGLLLLSLRAPQAAQAALLQPGGGQEPALCLLTYSTQDGRLLQWRRRVQRAEHALHVHPRFHVPAWDSGDGWTLLFPDPTIDMAQAQLFAGGPRRREPAPHCFATAGCSLDVTERRRRAALPPCCRRRWRFWRQAAAGARAAAPAQAAPHALCGG